MERKTYGYQFQMVQLIVRKTQKVEAAKEEKQPLNELQTCLLYTSPSPRDATLSRMPSSA